LRRGNHGEDNSGQVMCIGFEGDSAEGVAHFLKENTMNWKAIIHSAVVGLASLIVGAIEQYLQSGGVVPQNAQQWHVFLGSVGGTVLVGVSALLKQSPLNPAPPPNLSSKVPLVLLALLIPFTMGCKTASKPLPPGALNTFDATSYDALMQAQATLNVLKTDAPSLEAQVPAFKGILNQAIKDYDAAEAAWKTYHAGGGSSASVTAALAVMATDILKIQGIIPTFATRPHPAIVMATDILKIQGIIPTGGGK